MKALTREDIDRMTSDEKLELISELWDSLDEKDVSLTPAQVAELERRLATFEEDVKQAISWNELEAKLVRREHGH